MAFVTGALAFMVVLATPGLATAGSVDKTVLKDVLYSDVEPGNLLPQFMFMAGALEGGSIGVNLGGGRGEKLPFLPDDSCGDDIFEGANEDLRSPQLPYLTQDLWGCEREPTDVPAFALEDEHLKVVVTPQFAGKVWTIFDKKRGKDVLFNNRSVAQLRYPLHAMAPLHCFPNPNANPHGT